MYVNTCLSFTASCLLCASQHNNLVKDWLLGPWNDLGNAHIPTARTLFSQHAWCRPRGGAVQARPAGTHTGTAARRRHRGTGERPGLGLQRLPGPAEHCRPPPATGPAASGARPGGGNERRGLARPARRPGPRPPRAVPSSPGPVGAGCGRLVRGSRLQAEGRGRGGTGRVGPGPAAGSRLRLLPVARPGRLWAALAPGRPRENHPFVQVQAVWLVRQCLEEQLRGVVGRTTPQQLHIQFHYVCFGFDFKTFSGVFPGTMSSLTMKAHCLDKRGSFFKLIDTIASEIGELKHEMVQTDLTVEDESADLQSLVKDMGNVSPEKKDVKGCPRDSGYDSLSNKLSILDKLLHTHPVWLQLGLNDAEAMEILRAQPAGIFLVRKSARLQKKVISLRLPSDCGSCLKEFAIKESTYTFSLEGSGISFADLFRLIAFYCISRDVLPFTLKLPHAIAAAKTEIELEEIAQLGLNFWSSPANSNPPDPSPPRRPVPLDSACKGSRQLCLINGVHSIRTRTPSELECSQTNGALCFINPLFLKVHSQDVSGSLKRQSLRSQELNGTERPRSPPPRPPPPSINSILTSPQLSRTIKQASMPETVNHKKERDLDLLQNKPAPIPPPRLKKQAVCVEVEGSPKTAAVIRPVCSSVPAPEAAGVLGETPPEPALAASKKSVATSSESYTPRNGGRQRLSDVSISTSSSDSLDFDRSMPLFGYEGDTNSSLEDFEGESDQESMAPPLKPKKKRNSSFVLPKIVKSQLRKVSGVFSSFMTPEKRMIKKIAEMSRDKRTYFGCLVQDYISFLQENKECHVSSTDMLQTIRQFMTQVKNYLSQSSELDPPIESLIPEDQIDVVLEKAMHKCILKPLKGHIEAMLKEFHTADGSWKQLKENLQLVRQRNPQELGVFVPTPDFVDVEKIKVKFVTMQKMYSPEKKVMLLLRVCKLIYTVMENNSGRLYGADDFLPVLTYVLAQCDMLELDTEIEYMMELLDPSLLHGEGGYYLTSAYGALSLIKNFQEEQAARLLSSEARDTLRQWHKRRTTNRTIPSVDDFQNYLRVAFQEVNSGCTGKTLLVRPYITTEDVCQLCAEKFKVDNPKEYSLFLFIDDTWQQLTEDTYPQKIKAELHSRPQPQVFHFVYKRINSDPYGAIFQNNSAS